jgi:hypothetical protein
MALQYAVEDQIVECKRRLERIANDVVEIETGQALAFGETVGMDHDKSAKLFGFCPERSEIRIRKLAAGDVCKDLDTLQSKSAHQAIKFCGRLFSLHHRYAAESNEAVGLSRHVVSNAVIDDTCRLDTDLERNGVVALKRRWHHELNVDAHLIEIVQALSESVLPPGYSGVPIDILLCINLLGVGGRKKASGIVETSR